MSEKEIVQIGKLLEQLTESQKNLLPFLDDIIAQLTNNQLPTDSGISFLEVKNHLLLNYVTNLVYLCLHKLQGGSLKDERSIDRIIESRVFLERMRPVEQKLKYQLNKLIHKAKNIHLSETDSLNYRAHPENLISKLPEHEYDNEVENEEDTKSSSDGKSKKTQIYVPPRIAPMPYGKTEEKQKMDKIKKHILNSNILFELQQEFSEEPEEIHNTNYIRDEKFRKEIEEQKQYEEEYMVRLQTPRHQKNLMRQESTMTTLGDDLTYFGNLSNKQRNTMSKKSKLYKKTKRKYRS